MDKGGGIMERESGYYRVKLKDSGVWEVAYWVYPSHLWYLAGRFDFFVDEEFEQIDENRIKMPDEENG